MVAEAPLFETDLVVDEKNHTYFHKPSGRFLESVTDVLVSNRLIITTWFTEAGRERGRLVHQAIELDLKYPGELDENYEVGVDLEGKALPLFAPGELMGFVRGARKFVADFQFKPTMIEHALYHGTDMYAGRLDAAGPGVLRTRDRLLLVDWTLTTKLEVKRIQLAAYAYALPLPQSFVRIGVELKQDAYKWKEFPLEHLKKDMDDFRAGQRMLRLRREIGVKENL